MILTRRLFKRRSLNCTLSVPWETNFGNKAVWPIGSYTMTYCGTWLVYTKRARNVRLRQELLKMLLPNRQLIQSNRHLH